MSPLTITLFGKFSTLRGGKPLDGCESQKVQELFAFLLLNRKRPHAREVLASTLWDHHSTAQSRSYLRRLLWQLHHALEDHAPCPEEQHVLLIESDWVRINAEADFWLDVAVFEAGYAQARGVPGRHLDQESAEALQRAAELYTSDLLENWYQDWCLLERERLKNAYLIMLDKLMDYCKWSRKYEQGLQYGERILHIDPAREHTHRQIMQLLYLAGKRTDALRQYGHCARALREELDANPSKRTTLLYEQIREDQVDAIAVGLTPEPTSVGPAATLHSQLDHIWELREILTALQRHVQHDLEAIKRVLHEGR